MMVGSAAPWAAGRDPGSRGRLHGTQRCDVAVVGAGLTGLSTAVELLGLDPDRRVVVLEAEHVAAGASGRGTGLLGPRVGPALTVARKRYGDESARAAYLWSLDAVRHVLDLVERHRIACDLVAGSQLVAAADEKGAERQRREAEAARDLGLPVEPVSRAALPRHATRYVSALRYAPAATLDPAALTERLARIGEQRGLTIFERTAVREIKPGPQLTLRTDGGEVVADRVVVAVNAFGNAFGNGFAPAGVLGLTVQAGATEKLPQEALDDLDALRTEPLLGSGELSPYFRLTPDGRMVVGGGAVRRGTESGAAPLPERLGAAVRNLSPLLADVEIESTWAGPIGMTRDGLPVLGRHPDDPRLYHAGGCNGHGLAISVYQGAQLARWIADGGESPEPAALPWIRPKAPWLPRGRLMNRALDRYLRHLEAVSGREERQATR